MPIDQENIQDYLPDDVDSPAEFLLGFRQIRNAVRAEAKDIARDEAHASQMMASAMEHMLEATAETNDKPVRTDTLHVSYLGTNSLVGAIYEEYGEYPTYEVDKLMVVYKKAITSVDIERERAQSHFNIDIEMKKAE